MSPKACKSVVTFTCALLDESTTTSPEIPGPPFRRNGPQHIGQVFAPKARGRFQVLEFRVDRHAAALALHNGRAFHVRKQNSALKVERRGAAPMLVVHRFQAA